MKRPSKWEPGPGIYNYPDFERAVESGCLMFVLGRFKGRPVSGKVVANLSYSLVTSLIGRVRISVAVQTEDYRDWLRDELLGPQPVNPFHLAENHGHLLHGGDEE